MLVLALESATTLVGAALADGDGVVAELALDAASPGGRSPRRHVELLHPVIDRLLSLAGVAPADLDAVAADVGPGLFTGIRVGVAAAKGLAMSLGIPAVGLTSLEVLAAAAHDAGASGVVVPVVDLRRGEVAWSLGPAPAVGRPDALVAALEAARDDGEVVFCGGGARRYAGVLCDPRRARWRLAGPGLDAPPPSALARLAVGVARAGGAVDAAHLTPCYLREADAKINWTTRHDGPPGQGG